MRSADRGAVAHVFLAIAIALPLLVGIGSIGAAMIEGTQSVLNQWLLALLGLAFLAAVVWAALLPPVRPVEIATARTLLSVDLPDARRPQAWASRRRGAAWLGLLASLGIVLSVALLYLLPVGVALLAHPLTDQDSLDWPGGGTWHTGTGWSAAWLALFGLIALLISIVLVVGAGRLLRRLAPRVLGPTLMDQVAERADRERELARANELAREVHDGVGHTLTAMTLQVTAARRLLRADPDAADRSLAAVEDLGRRAQADVDDVVGALRAGARRSAPAPPEQDLRTSLDGLIADSPLRLDLDLPRSASLPGPVADTVTQVVREALTNAARHGTGAARLSVQRCAAEVFIEVSNQISPDAVPTTGRRGLTGLRERVLLAGGTVNAGAEGDQWMLRVTLPTT